jgi:FtsP/CotA-like multicopper oxidase with cupredoxin domain
VRHSSFDPRGGSQSARRNFLKGSALATGAFFINSKFSRVRLAEEPTSPFTTPWVQPLRFPGYAVPLPSFQPLPGPPVDAAMHQYYDQFTPQYRYDYTTCEALGCPHPQLGLSKLSTFCGCMPGPTFMMKYGVPALVRIRNCMPTTMQGFGSPETSTHVHNGHHASESDGYPGYGVNPGEFIDHHYANVCAGFSTDGGHGDPLEAKHTLWYHDHCLDFTSQNVYRGLAGFYLLFDDKDSGNELDPNPDAFRLPSGVPDGKRVRNRYDIPLMLIDMRFDQNGIQVMDVMNMDGHLGDKYTVNGIVQPYFEVERRKYRFRILDAGPSRFYDIWLSNSMEFQHIGNDGNLLPAPIPVNNVKLGVAERADIVVDFSQLPATTTEIYLVNRAEQTNGRGPSGNTLPMASAPKLLKFVIRPGAVADGSRVPASLMPRPLLDLPVAQERNWHFDRSNGMWTVNGQLVDLSRCDAEIRRGTAEIWNISTAGGWAHPVHMHLEEYHILSYNGQSVAGTGLAGRKDVFALYPGDQMRIYMKFRDFVGKYVMHCHNVVHEDHAMMVRWDIVP